MSPADPASGERERRPVPGRHAAILAALRTRGQIKAVRLADELGVTHETIRKDLLTLESHGLLRRVHGGAVPVETLTYEPRISARTSMTAEKQRIAAAATHLLPPAGAVLIDSGTTTAALVATIPAGSTLVAVTNALPIALALLAHPQLTVHLLGGRVRRTTMASVDTWALRELREIRADVAFVGTNAFSLTHGLSTPDSAEAAVKAAMIESARLTVLLADHTKFGRESVFRYADLDAIDVLVTDEGLRPSDAAAMRSEAGIEVLRV
ncbi:DeoR/GlpR family DNA-binding transcription regulator [Humibacillus sp. DSM 29435]|uniref:DeoR/GlpR family DNA-binding transcription regulator n=1 Tax=Humibacillus sp. DSM 29435 TaxID=1869167 RepID=UPI001586EF48|nr:DeoR/GlpR family DNA-binding transcription regulator [Humibacillus sp. DSM 29435]